MRLSQNGREPLRLPPVSIVWPSSHLWDCGLAARNNVHVLVARRPPSRQQLRSAYVDLRTATVQYCTVSKNYWPRPRARALFRQTHVQHPPRYGSNVLRREVEISRCAGYCTSKMRSLSTDCTNPGKVQNTGQQNFREPMSRRILNGWKEISNHIERGVRTAQRWESSLGMPVHRPALKNRSAVVAFSDELDGWLSRSSPDAQAECLAVNDNEENNRNLLRVLDGMSTLIRQTRQLICHMKVLQESRWRPAKIHHHRMESKARVHNSSTAARGRASLLIFPRRKRSSASRLPNAASPIADATFSTPPSSEKAR